MPDGLMIALVGLIGAVIGGAASVGAIWVQSHYQHRRERMRTAVDLAMYAHREKNRARQTAGRRASVPDFTASLSTVRAPTNFGVETA